MATFIFDVDNTLTSPRQKILNEHLKIFSKFIVNKKIYLVSGSDYEKICYQLPDNILYNISGIFTCLGNCFHIKNELKYINNSAELNNLELRKDIKTFIENSKTPIKTGNHIEERIGMLNISSIGRNATISQRKMYNDFDTIHQERKIFANFIKTKYANLDASVGGEISIDISIKGHDKSQIIDHIGDKNNLIFFGDKCDNGGNDEPLAQEIRKLNGTVYDVKNYIETFKILNKLILLKEGG